MTFAPISEILDELRQGRPIVLVDDPDRENEGDLCFAAEFASPELINLMIRECRGWVCLAMASEICDQLGLHPQVPENQSRFGTAFTVTIEARVGVTTGISAKDRCTTILAAARPDARPEDPVTRPHRAVAGLRGRRAGAHRPDRGIDPAGRPGCGKRRICEIMRDDGEMARLPDLEAFCQRHGVKMACIADLVEYRRRRERLIERVATAKMPTQYGFFDSHTYVSKVDGRVHVALTVGIDRPGANGRFPPIERPVLVRVHSQCLTGDVFGSLRCDCGQQLHKAMQRVQAEGLGIVLYISQEGRGIGLANKLRAYALQDGGMDTVEANRHLGFRPDEREFGTGAQILHDLGARNLRVLTNNPKKLTGLQGYGLEVVGQEPILIEPNPHNQQYLETKRDKLGHLLGRLE
jgi:3,4-dihydroxy 2-butanone 4-phosphate synthase/GTP cyclohydrolase II